MSESIWWPDEYWWEKRSVPLGFVTLSPLGLLSLVVWGALALLVSLPFNFPVGGISFGGRALAFLVLMMVGLSFVRRRSKMVPVQMQLLYLLMTRSTAKKKSTAGAAAEREAPKARAEEPYTLEAESTTKLRPMTIVGRCRRTKLPRKASLYIDGVPRKDSEAYTVPKSNTQSEYQIVFLPTVADIGVHDLEVRIEGEAEPAYKAKVEVKVKGFKALELKK